MTRAEDWPAGAQLGLAVSGGPDSLALLLLAPAGARAATVDHGLRPEARAEAAFVAGLCRARGVAHDVLTVDLPAGSGQAAARTARYAALTDWCRTHGLTHLATGHHADDQAETVLMRLARGAGLAGLSGIRRARPLAEGVTLVRPLLGRRKAELQAMCTAAGIAAVADPSNSDPRYARTAARALLAATDWLDAERIAASAAHLIEAEAALAWATDRIAAERLTADGLDPHGLPPEIVRRLVLRAFEGLGETPRGPELARLVAALDAGRTATLGRVKAVPGARWRFAPAPPRRGRRRA